MKFYVHLTIEERICLQDFHSQGYSKRKIAKLMGRSPSTVYRELARNGKKDGSYNFWWGTSLYIHRRKKSVRTLRLQVDSALIDFVEQCLDKFWSPEIIVAKWKMQNKNTKLSARTIYNALKRKILRRHCAKRYLRRRNIKRIRNSQTIKPNYFIRD